MNHREQFEQEKRSKFKGVELLFETSSQKYIEWLESKLSENKSTIKPDFYTELMQLINNHCKDGLKKQDLIHKMKYALTSCELS
jgi:hypothetical protein